MHRVPYGLDVSVSIRRDSEHAYVDVYAPMYMRKYWTMQHCYSLAFTDGEILKDHSFITQMCNHYPT